jgi:Protein of unknown function (DUF3467)
MEQEQQPEAQKSETAQFNWRPIPGTPQIYTNYVTVSWTLFDVRFVFGQLIPAEPGKKNFIVEERGAVTFAWPEAKALRDMLANLVAKYEEANGEIKPLKLPPIPEGLDKAK